MIASSGDGGDDTSMKSEADDESVPSFATLELVDQNIDDDEQICTTAYVAIRLTLLSPKRSLICSRARPFSKNLPALADKSGDGQEPSSNEVLAWNPWERKPTHSTKSALYN
jgi:hypothetical protein